MTQEIYTVSGYRNEEISLYTLQPQLPQHKFCFTTWQYKTRNRKERAYQDKIFQPYSFCMSNQLYIGLDQNNLLNAYSRS